MQFRRESEHLNILGRRNSELRHRNVRRPDSLNQNKDVQAALYGSNLVHGDKGAGGLGVRGGTKEGDLVRGKAKEVQVIQSLNAILRN